MAYCKKCGEELNSGAKFCPSCGEATSKSNESGQECREKDVKTAGKTNVRNVKSPTKTRVVHKRKKNEVSLNWWIKIAVAVAILILVFNLMIIPDSLFIICLNFVGAIALIFGLVSAYRGKIDMDGIKALLVVSVLWYPVMRGLDYLISSREKDKIENFSDFSDALPSNGSRLFVAEDTKPCGSKNVTLKRVILYEKNDERDYELDGVTSSGRGYSEKGGWFPDKSETYQAREYNFTKLCAGNILTECTNYFIDYQGYVYFCTGIMPSSEDVAKAFQRGAIAKLRVATKSEEDDWRQGKSSGDKNQSAITINPSSPEEKKYAENGYNDGAEFGAIGGLMGGFGGVLDVADAVGVTDEEMDGVIKNAATRKYDEKYDTPTSSEQKRLKEIYIQHYIEGFKSKTKTSND